MACGNSDVKIPKFVDGYPSPTPPEWKKRDRYDEEEMKAVDAKAKEVKLVNETYEQLAGKLTGGYETDLEKVRAIFTWLGSQDKDSIPTTETTGKATPLDYLHGLFEDNKSFGWHEIFTLICRGANLPCVVIHGNCKGTSYEVGQQDVSCCRGSWNAVFVDGSWQIIHPFWAFTAVSGHDTGRWTKIEDEGKSTREKGEKSEGTSIRKFDEDYFCPDPEEFIYKCIADKKEWQLLIEPIELDKFRNFPEFQFAYFQSDFKLTSAHDAILKSVDGMCQMEFDEKEGSIYRLGYELYFDEGNSEEKLPAAKLPQYIFYETNGSKLRLLVRFRLIGIYRLSIYERYRLFDICLHATEKSQNENCIPANPRIGYGYGHTAKYQGIKEPSHRSGVVVMSKYQEEQISFQMVQAQTILPVMRHATKDSENLRDFIKKSVNGNNVSIKVTVPDNEEYALQVYRHAEREECNVLNYLLTTNKRDFPSLDDMKAEQTPYQRVKDRKKRQEDMQHYRQILAKAMKKRDLDQLERAITAAQSSGYKELEQQIEKAKKLVIDLKMQDINDARGQSVLEDLRAARRGKTIDKLEDAIASMARAVRDLVEAYENAVKDALDGEEHLSNLAERAKTTTAAEDLEKSHKLLKATAQLRQQKQIKGWKILKKDTAFAFEIKAYKNPSTTIEDIMRCTCILLGKDYRKLTTWTDITDQMKETGDICQKMKNLKIDKLHHHQVEWAQKLMEKYTFQDAMAVSAALPTFYSWNNEIIAEATSRKKTSH